ncbi:MAG TPA: ABC transporter permease [Planctomycetes bacterium]|nr:ABC transporter permease [Planctomycetota bacterium]HIL36671.1 ABC transporter permease [Planctomycetota bacterium]
MKSLRALLLIVRRSLRKHALSTTVTVVSAALASGLVMAVFAVAAQSRAAFAGGPVGFDAVLGARGSATQLVLNTVFHLETSPGNIPWTLYKEVSEDSTVELAIPYAVGDNYRGLRIVGTTSEIFTKFEYVKGQKFEFVGHGEPFDETLRQAVVGSEAARISGLKRGDTFQPSHGVLEFSAVQHDERYVVSGVLEPTNSPSDRVIWIPIEGIFRMGGHILRGTGENFEAEAGATIPDEHKEVSAVMLKFKAQIHGLRMENRINRQGKVATLAWPIANVVAQLFERLGWVNRILELVAYLVVVVAGGGLLSSIYNTMNERRREFAILRALGARRRTVFSAIVLEAMTISVLGSLLGYLVYGAIMVVAASIIRERTGVVLDTFEWHSALVLTPIAMLVVGAIAGILPARKAYATDVASTLSGSL